MIRRIVLENYMAHVRTVIEPANGLTVLIGPNNCGKSALIHALEMVCYNSDAADFAIRHGAKKATVTIETEDEDGTVHTITWWRKEKTAGYVIDGREISGQGRGKIPDDLHDYLRMPMIESAAGGKEFLLHFGLQKSPIFLLDDPPSRAAQFFASATDADKLMQMQKSHQMKTTYAKRDKERLDGELSQLDRQLETLTSLPSLSEQLTDLEDEHFRLSELSNQIGATSVLVKGLEMHGRSAAHSAHDVKALAKLEKPPALADTEPLTDWIETTRGVVADTRAFQLRGNALRELREAPDISDPASLRHTCHDLEDVARRAGIQRRRADIVSALVPPSEPNDVPGISGIVEKMTGGENQLVRWGAQRGAFARFAAPPELEDISPLTELLSELVASAKELNRREAERGALKSLKAMPAFYDTDALRREIGEILRAAEGWESQAAKAKALSSLAPPTEPANLQPLAESIRRIDSATAEEIQSREFLRKLNEQVEEFEREINRWVEMHPRCAACGQSVSAELIMGGGHRHE